MRDRAGLAIGSEAESCCVWMLCLDVVFGFCPFSFALLIFSCFQK